MKSVLALTAFIFSASVTALPTVPAQFLEPHQAPEDPQRLVSRSTEETNSTANEKLKKRQYGYGGGMSSMYSAYPSMYGGYGGYGMGSSMYSAYPYMYGGYGGYGGYGMGGGMSSMYGGGMSSMYSAYPYMHGY